MLEGSSFLGNAGGDGDAGTFSPPPALWQPAGYSSSGQGGASTGAAAATMRHTDRGSVQSPIEFNNTHSKANPLLFSQRSPSPSACTCSMCVSECNECCHDCAVELRTNASGAICTAVTLLAIIYACTVCTVFIGGDTASDGGGGGGATRINYKHQIPADFGAFGGSNDRAALAADARMKRVSATAAGAVVGAGGAAPKASDTDADGRINQNHQDALQPSVLEPGAALADNVNNNDWANSKLTAALGIKTADRIVPAPGYARSSKEGGHDQGAPPPPTIIHTTSRTTCLAPGQANILKKWMSTPIATGPVQVWVWIILLNMRETASFCCHWDSRTKKIITNLPLRLLSMASQTGQSLAGENVRVASGGHASASAAKGRQRNPSAKSRLVATQQAEAAEATIAA